MTFSAPVQYSYSGRLLSYYALIQARDAYYNCIDGLGVEFSTQQSVLQLKECFEERRRFESSCKASWVKHFDQSKDKENKVYRTLKTNIGASVGKAVGGLEGRDQRSE